MHALSAANKLLDAQLTDNEFRASVTHNKFLSDCRRLGFPDLVQKGHNCGGITIPPKKVESDPDFNPLEFATQAAALISEKGFSTTGAAARWGKTSTQLRHYCRKFNIELAATSRRKWDYDATFKKAQRMINQQGFRMRDAARQIDGSPKLLLDIFAAKGYKYNAKTVRVEKVKK